LFLLARGGQTSIRYMNPAPKKCTVFSASASEEAGWLHFGTPESKCLGLGEFADKGSGVRVEGVDDCSAEDFHSVWQQQADGKWCNGDGKEVGTWCLSKGVPE
jgi:hypothetical protein